MLRHFSLSKHRRVDALGNIIESRHSEFPVGNFVLANAGRRKYWASDGDGATKIDSALAPLQAYLGVLGMDW